MNTSARHSHPAGAARRTALAAWTAVIMAAAAATPAVADDPGLYLQFPDAPGQSVDGFHRNWIDLRSLSWGASNSGSLHVGAGGGGGEAAVTTVDWTQGIDTSVPNLVRAMVAGQAAPNARFNLVGPGATRPYLSLELEDAGFASINLAADEARGTLAFGKITLGYDPAARGESGLGTRTTFDVSRNQISGSITRAPAQKLTGTAPAAVAGQTSLYLRLGGASDPLAGDSRVAGYENWIAIDAADWGASTAWSVSGTTGPVSVQDLRWTQAIDATLPASLALLASGKSLSQATLEFVRLGEAGPVTFMQLAFGRSMVTGLMLDGSGLVDQSMNFESVTQTVWQIRPDGTRGAAVSIGYDIPGRTVSPGVVAAGVKGFGEGNLSPLAIAAVPEPGTWVLMLGGLGVLLAAARRRAAAEVV